MMEYLGYVGSVVFDNEAGILHGRVINTTDVITFQGKSVEEIREAFHDSVDDYIDFCKKRNEEPEKPMSGKFNIRISPRLHALAVGKARSIGVSLNTLAEKAIEQFVNAASIKSEKAQLESHGKNIAAFEDKDEYQFSPVGAVIKFTTPNSSDEAAEDGNSGHKIAIA